MTTFDELGLSPQILEAVAELGYTEATPVQEQTIPTILKGCDVAAAAQTGTGKTAAFTLPTLQLVGESKKPKRPAALVITPTRELAQQIDRVATTVGKKTGQRTVTVVGGVGYEPQIKKLASGCELLVATPGRLLDLVEKRAVDLRHIKILILDEADRMLDMGFLPQVRRIIGFLPKERQTLLFSATLDKNVMRQVTSLLHDPIYVEIARRGTTAETIEQRIMPVDQSQKPELLLELLDRDGAFKVIIFTRTKHRADAVASRLKKRGYKAQAIHADRSQSQRQRALDSFHKGKIDVLVATDVLSRGIDVSNVSHVINYDVPMNPEDYVHRVGRTGRAGEQGRAYTFVGPDEVSQLREIEYLLGSLIPTYDLEGFSYRSGRIIPNPKRPTKRGGNRPAFSRGRGRGRRL